MLVIKNFYTGEVLDNVAKFDYQLLHDLYRLNARLYLNQKKMFLVFLSQTKK